MSASDNALTPDAPSPPAISLTVERFIIGAVTITIISNFAVPLFLMIVLAAVLPFQLIKPTSIPPETLSKILPATYFVSTVILASLAANFVQAMLWCAKAFQDKLPHRMTVFAVVWLTVNSALWYSGLESVGGFAENGAICTFAFIFAFWPNWLSSKVD